MRRRLHVLAGVGCIALGVVLFWTAVGRVADRDEFAVKRQEPHAFAEKPTVTANGDRVEVRFAVQAYCDVTVAVEDAAGRIVRHLASGVLGDNAPAPFQKKSLKLSLVWDGKNDQGQYAEREGLTIRVALGLKPQFEKNLYWSPHKRIGEAVPLMQAAPEGIYVFDALGVDTLKLFDHRGDYVRTVYPFPADKLERVEGLTWQDFPQDGKKLPLKNSLYLQTLLTSGDNASRDDRGGMTGAAATAMAVRDGRLALAKLRLNRLATDGSTGGKVLTGPRTAVRLEKVKWQYKTISADVYPTSAALSPDGKWLYLTGYAWRYPLNFDATNCVLRLELDGDREPEVFKGSPDPNVFGKGDDQLTVPTSVDCDSKGRVYVSDFMNDRIQVYDADGKLLKSIATEKPALVRIHRKTDEIFAFTWLLCNRHLHLRGKDEVKHTFTAKLRHYGQFDAPALKAEYPLPLPEFKGTYGTYTGLDHAALYSAEIDSWTEPLTVWLGRDCNQNLERGVHPGDGGRSTPWDKAGLQLLQLRDGKLEVVRDFGQDTVRQVQRARPPSNAIQQLVVNPSTGKLYVGEADSGATVKAFKQLLEVDPETGAVQLINAPFNALEAAFDLDGQIYLRTTNVVVRYRFPEWREVPYDYGEELPQVGCGMFGRFSKSTAGLVIPATSPACFHQGGMFISPKGHLIAACAYRHTGEDRKREKVIRADVAGGAEALHGKPYTPRVYPGRMFSSTGCCIHVWDKHGKLLHEDAVPGMPQTDGVAMDREGNIYVMATPTRVVDGTKYFDEMSETLLKFRPGDGKFLSFSTRAPVPLTEKPDRPPMLHNGTLSSTWVEGAQWLYGGVGFAGFNSSRAGGGCACWFSRFTLDLFARSIAPEPTHFSVAILDSNGNLITRVGRYGNVDSAGPKSLVPLDGDGVGLMHACYVGTHTDRRLFISDVGNGRIVSVKLGYHANEKVQLPTAKTR